MDLVSESLPEAIEVQGEPGLVLSRSTGDGKGKTTAALGLA